jgi:F0F1-type ATP synthase membrane subunit b/b'
VVVDNALSEARQQAATLKALLAELRAKTEAPKREASRLDDLAKRRDERRRAAGL